MKHNIDVELVMKVKKYFREIRKVRVAFFSLIKEKGVLLMAEMVRVNTRISSTVNDWLDEYSKRSGMPKSTIIFLAVEQFKRDQDTIAGMQNMGNIVERLDQLQAEIREAVQRNGTKS